MKNLKAVKVGDFITIGNTFLLLLKLVLNECQMFYFFSYSLLYTYKFIFIYKYIFALYNNRGCYVVNR